MQTLQMSTPPAIDARFAVDRGNRKGLAAGADRSDAIWKFVLIAIAATLIRLTPLLQRDTDYALPGMSHFTPAQRAAAGATPWRQLAVHNDSFEYLQLAEGIDGGCGFARLIGGRCQAAEILRTPGYPLFLSVFPGVGWALAAQVVASGLACLLIAFCVNARWGIAAALTSEILVALDIPTLVLSSQVMSESLFTILLLTAAILPLLAIRQPKHAAGLAIISGLAASFSVLVRPIGLLLPLCTPLPFLIMDTTRTRRLAIAGIAFALPALTVCAWSARNYKVAGYPGLSTVGAVNLYFYRAANVVARERNERLEVAQADFADRIREPFLSVYETHSIDLVRRLNRLAIRILLRHPFEIFAITAQSTAYMALSPMRAPLAYLLGIPTGPPSLGLSAGAPSLARVRAVLQGLLESPALTVLEAFQVLMVAITWIGVARALLRWREASTEYRMWSLYLFGLAVLMLALAAGGEADVRFRVPAVPLLAVVAGLGYFATDPAHAASQSNPRRLSNA
jgi:hypothetical protein